MLLSKFIKGYVRNIQRNSEGKNTILDFRVESFDEKGSSTSVTPIQFSGRKIRGSISEGDEVEIIGTNARTGINPLKIYNHSTKQHIEDIAFPRLSIAAIIIATYAFIFFVIVPFKIPSEDLPGKNLEFAGLFIGIVVCFMILGFLSFVKKYIFITNLVYAILFIFIGIAIFCTWLIPYLPPPPPPIKVLGDTAAVSVTAVTYKTTIGKFLSQFRFLIPLKNIALFGIGLLILFIIIENFRIKFKKRK